MISRPADSSEGQHPGTSPARCQWTVADLLTWTESHFTKLGLATPRLDAELLLAHAMETSRLELYTGYRKIVEVGERAVFRGLVTRRGQFEPVAYILGVREFYSLAFEVGPAVLIPRPETEHVVDRVLQEVRATGTGEQALAMLDLGTGSGNIIIALLVNLPAARAVAVDVSPEALAVARRNARHHGVADRIEFLEGDLFEPVAASGGDPPVFDVVVSNPPYVSRADFAGLMPDVRNHEPAIALRDGKAGNGLGFYRAIVEAATRFTRPGSLLALEVGAGQAASVEKLLAAKSWSGISAMADYAGIPRVVTARQT